MRWVVCLLALVLAPAPAAAERATITTQNVRVTLPPGQARADIRQAAEHSSLLLLQEMHRRWAHRYEPPRWGHAQAPQGGPLHRRDCAVMWSHQVWAERGQKVPRLSSGGTFEGADRWAVLVQLQHRASRARAIVVCVHLSPRPARNQLQRQTLLPLLASLRADLVVVGGDWNRRRPQLAAQLHRRGYVSGGGNRVDSVWWRRPARQVAPWRVIRPTFSDHDGVRYRLAFPAL